MDVPLAQPSSRDASDEGAEDAILQEVTSKKERQADAHVSSKRTRSDKNGDGENGDVEGGVETGACRCREWLGEASMEPWVVELQHSSRR